MLYLIYSLRIGVNSIYSISIEDFDQNFQQLVYWSHQGRELHEVHLDQATSKIISEYVQYLEEDPSRSKNQKRAIDKNKIAEGVFLFMKKKQYFSKFYKATLAKLGCPFRLTPSQIIEISEASLAAEVQEKKISIPLPVT